MIGDVPSIFHSAFQLAFSTKRLVINSDLFDDLAANHVLWKNLTFLTEIDLRNCSLHFIPFEFSKLNAVTLKVVRLTGNPWVGFHRALIDSNPSVTTLLSESEKSLQGADISCMEVKVNLLGEPGVGKSTLLRRIKGVTSASDEMSLHMKGKSLATEVLDSAEFTIEGIRFVCYDFGGQHLYRHAHSFFLSPHSLCLLCIDLTEIDSVLKGHLRTWMDAIVQRSPKVTVVIVGTKCRSALSASALSERLENFENLLKGHYPGLLFGFVAVDSLCDDGIHRLKSALTHLARKKVREARR